MVPLTDAADGRSRRQARADALGRARIPIVPAENAARLAAHPEGRRRHRRSPSRCRPDTACPRPMSRSPRPGSTSRRRHRTRRTPTMQLTGIHHLTAVTARAPRQPRLLYADARHAAGQEDRQPGRCQRLSSVLCRRAGVARQRHHLLRLAGGRERRGTHTITRTGLRVAGAGSARLVASSASKRAGRRARRLVERDGRAHARLRGFRRPAPQSRRRWRRRRRRIRGTSSPVPAEHQIRGPRPDHHERARSEADRSGAARGS